MIATGMRIKVFPDTDVEAYKNMIADEGYHSKLEGDYIVVGNPFKDVQRLTAFAYRFKETRLRMRVSKEYLAEQIGVTKQTITNWELGIRMPKYEFRDRVTEVMGIEFDTAGGQT